MRTAIWLFLCLVSPLSAQAPLHLVVALASGSRVSLTANSIVRDGDYPSVIRMAGAVEIQSQVCLPIGTDGKLVCDGYTIVRAEAATFHEATGKIEAAGSVTIMPLQHEPAAKKP